MLFRIAGGQVLIYNLHIIQNVLFGSLARTFSKSPVVNQNHVVLIPVKIPGIFAPAFNAAGITMKIKYESLGFVHIKMNPVDSYSRFRIKK